MAVSGMAFFVFLLPVVGSLLIGTLVLNEILKEPDRNLNVVPFQIEDEHEILKDSLKIIDFKKEYSKKTPFELHVLVSDEIFECGDLYVNIYDFNSRKMVDHKEFYGQCFLKYDSLLPIDDILNIQIDSEGIYEIEILIIDKHKNQKTSINERFIVK